MFPIAWYASGWSSVVIHLNWTLLDRILVPKLIHPSSNDVWCFSKIELSFAKKKKSSKTRWDVGDLPSKLTQMASPVVNYQRTVQTDEKKERSIWFTDVMRSQVQLGSWWVMSVVQFSDSWWVMSVVQVSYFCILNWCCVPYMHFLALTQILWNCIEKENSHRCYQRLV